MSVPPLATAVAATLESEPGEPRLSRALGLIRSELSAARLSLHAGGHGSFHVLAGCDEEPLASGTQVPVEASSQIDGSAEGRVLTAVGFDQGGFDRPTGWCSSSAVGPERPEGRSPLFRGSEAFEQTVATAMAIGNHERGSSERSGTCNE